MLHLLSIRAKYHLHDGRTFSGSRNSWIQMNFASSAMHLHELGRIRFLQNEKIILIRQR